MALPLPLLHLYNNSLYIHAAASPSFKHCICTASPLIMLHCATAYCYCTATQLLRSKQLIHPNSDIPVRLETLPMLNLPLPQTSGPSSDLCAATTNPCILHRCTPLCAILHWCNTLVPLALLQPASLALPKNSWTVALSVASSASVSTYIRQSCYSSSGLP